MDVYVVTEHEPTDDEFPLVVARVFSTHELAKFYVAVKESKRDANGPHIWWEIERHEVLMEDTRDV